MCLILAYTAFLLWMADFSYRLSSYLCIKYTRQWITKRTLIRKHLNKMSLLLVIFKGLFQDESIIIFMASISRCPHKKLKSKISAYSNFVLWKITIDFYVENIIGSDTFVIIHIIGSSAKINKSLQLCFRISCFLSLRHQTNANDQNVKILTDPSHKIWE